MNTLNLQVSTWDPETGRSLNEIRTTNTFAIYCMKENIPNGSLRVCTTIESNAGYVADTGDYDY